MFYGTYKLMMNRYSYGSSHKASDRVSRPPANTAGRRRARRALLAKSDRLLADMGFSRELLKQGVNAWPWRVVPEVTGQAIVKSPIAPHHTHRPIKAEPQLVSEQRQAA